MSDDYEWEADFADALLEQERERDREERERQAELERDRLDRFRDRGDMGEKA